jgi:hypothetical protein
VACAIASSTGWTDHSFVDCDVNPAATVPIGVQMDGGSMVNATS